MRGVKITVGPPFFDKVNAPLALGPDLPDGRGAADCMAALVARIVWLRAFAVTGLVRRHSPASAAFIAGLRQWYVLTALSLAAFVLGTILVEFRRGVSARRHMVHEIGAARAG